MLKNIKDKIKNKYFILGFLIILNLSIKVFILLNSNQLADPALDKCYLVHFARDMLLKEDRLSILYYFDTHDIVPGLLTGTLLTILFMIFGVSGYVMKMIPILTSTAIVALAYCFLYKHFNKKAAIITSLIFIFAPFTYTIRTFIAWEDYKGSILLTFLIMYIFFDIFYNKKKNYWNFILLGLISGFALSFYLMNFILILAFVILWFSFDKKFFIKKNFLIFLISFIIILSPLIMYNYTHDFASFDIITRYLKTDNSLLTHKSSMPIHSNLFSLITEDIPASFNFNDIGFINGALLNYAYYFIFIISFVFILYKNRLSFVNFIKNVFFLKNKKGVNKEIIFIVYPILYISAYLLLGLTPFSQFYHTHILPIYPFIFISIGLFTSYTYKERVWKILSITMAIFVLFLGLKCSLDLLSFGAEKADYLEECNTEQTKYRFVGIQLKNISLAKKECQKLDREDWKSCYENIGGYIGKLYLIEKNISRLIDDCQILDDSSKGCIRGLTIYAGGDENAPEICLAFPNGYQKECFFNFGRSIALSGNAVNYKQECKITGDEYFNDCKKGYLAEKKI